ncbi:hypothetical protein [Dietzia maris]|uniref:hypothetical protein n=1 Tax=Dietzia maris TaxID=37915 RepID=UPI00232D7EED|nr:hypothetical protein [Dietzia maris]
MIETIDELKAALGVKDLRQMSGRRVLDLLKMVQNGEVSTAIQAQLALVAPETMVRLAKAIDDSAKRAIDSNDQSSSNLHEQIAMSKWYLGQIIQDPNTSEAARRDALDRLERYDDKLFEHDVHNKRFNLESLKISKDAVLGVATLALVAGGALTVPGSRKWLTDNGGRFLVDATRKALPGK